MEYINNPQLQLAYDYVEFTGKNIFLTGKAGTGKTTFLHNLKNVSSKRLVVVAPTGVAAINAKGVTIHSFFQLPFGPQIPGVEAASMKSKSRRFNKEKINIIRSMDLLVIDEISMVRADLLDGIDLTLRRFRKKNLPFGGVQLLMIGDLQQLAPVVKDDEWNLLRDHYDTAFFFSSKALTQTTFVSIELNHVFRQSDEKFINLLNNVRDNNITDEVVNALNKRHIPNFTPDDGDYIILTTHNSKAKQINEEKLNKLSAKEHSYNAKVTGLFPDYNYPTDFELIVKKGAQVMFVKNDPNPAKEYYNGKIGKVTGFTENNIIVECVGDEMPIEVGKVEWEKIKYTLNKSTNEISETIEGTFTQYPLKLAWAITIHKSQGLTFEHAIIDAQAAFAHGQVYVALSRCKTLEGMVLSSPIYRKSIKHDSTINSFTKHVEENQPTQEKLVYSKSEYEFELLADLFDFSTMLNQISQLIRLLQDNYSSVQNNPVDKITSLKKEVDLEIISVSKKFKYQLQQLFTENNSVNENNLLQDRVIKAVPYFLNKLSKIVITYFSNITFETDNKSVNKSLKKAIDQLKLEYTIKQISLSECKDGFNVVNYLKTRAIASIEKDKPSDKEKPKNDIINKGNEKELSRILKAWRNAKAEELDWQVYRVIQLKTINEICEKLPTTPKELSKITGIGKTKLSVFGDELLDVINDYIDENRVS